MIIVEIFDRKLLNNRNEYLAPFLIIVILLHQLLDNYLQLYHSVKINAKNNYKARITKKFK